MPRPRVTSMFTAVRSLRARWVFPVAGEPLEHGVVTFAQGRITTVSAANRTVADLGAGQDLGNVALLPGLVDAH